jgi:hypothetical protein
LLHLSFRLEEYGAVFCAVVYVTTTVHAVQRLECVWASALIMALTGHASSMVILI